MEGLSLLWNVCNETAFLLSPVKPSFATRNNVKLKPKAKDKTGFSFCNRKNLGIYRKKVNTPVFTSLGSNLVIKRVITNFCFEFLERDFADLEERKGR